MTVLSTASTLSQAFKNAGRVREILTVFGSHGFAEFVRRMELQRFLPNRLVERERYRDIPAPERLRQSFEELGPTFVKLGQVLATRADLLPEAFVEEFAKLQDKVATLPFAEIRSVIETELKGPLEAFFSDFDAEPQAAASIAQVHFAQLKSGEKVAVKVQRPGIERQIQNDVSILRGLAEAMERYVPESRIANPKGLVEEFFRTILFELDFRVEANNMKRIAANMRALESVKVPKVYGAFSSGRVIVLERFEGVRFSDRAAILAQGLEPVQIVETGASAFFRMVMRDGLFHADLHEGNLFILRDGKIGFIDFGIVGRLSLRVRDSIMSMFVALVEEDYETLANEYLDLCQVTGNVDFARLQKDLLDSISPYVGMSLGEVNVGQVLLRSTTIAARHHLQVPRDLMLLFKAILTIESLGKRLEPDFDILSIGHRLAREALGLRYSRERLQRDLLTTGREVQTLVETLPKVTKRFLRKWVADEFVLTVANRDTDLWIQATRRFVRAFLLVLTGLGFLHAGIQATVQVPPQFFGLPYLGWICFVGTGYSIWLGLRQVKRRKGA